MTIIKLVQYLRYIFKIYSAKWLKQLSLYILMDTGEK